MAICAVHLLGGGDRVILPKIGVAGMSKAQGVASIVLVSAFFVSLTIAANASAYDDAIGDYNHGDYAAAAKVLQPLVSAQNAAAQSMLAKMYWFGLGMPRDKSRALHLAGLAAEAGDAQGEAILGAAYFTGAGVPQDKVRGISLLRKAALQNNANAELDLAKIYITGNGVVKDYRQGLAYEKQAVESGSYIAEWGYSDMLSKGLYGLARDPVESLRLSKLSAAQGFAPAAVALAFDYYELAGMPHDGVSSEAWAIVAADMGCDYAQQIVQPFMMLRLSSTDRTAAFHRAAVWMAGHQSKFRPDARMAEPEMYTVVGLNSTSANQLK